MKIHKKPINQSIDQSINQSINRRLKQESDQSTNQAKKHQENASKLFILRSFESVFNRFLFCFSLGFRFTSTWGFTTIRTNNDGSYGSFLWFLFTRWTRGSVFYSSIKRDITFISIRFGTATKVNYFTKCTRFLQCNDFCNNFSSCSFRHLQFSLSLPWIHRRGKQHHGGNSRQTHQVSLFPLPFLFISSLFFPFLFFDSFFSSSLFSVEPE